MSNRRKPILFIVIATFWVGYIIVSLFLYTSKMSEVVQDNNRRRQRVIEYQKYIASPLMAEEKLDALIENLDKAKGADQYDFYVLRQADKLIGFHFPGRKPEEVATYKFPLGPVALDKGNFFVWTIQVGEVTLSLGISMRGSAYIAKTLVHYKWDFIQDIAVVTLFLGLVLYLALKDILDLTRLLQSRRRGPARLVKARTREAEILLNVTSQYEEVAKSLKVSNQTYADSVSPAVRYELNQNTPVPHLFQAIVVRVDVNGYTQMFLERKDEFVTSTLNRYFQRAAEVIHRYGGHIYQYVGDEIVLHFKEMDHERPMEVAIGCVRSLFAVAKDLDEELRPKGIPFVVKAAMVRGRLRFINLDTGYAFAGLPLIESVRMLGKIEEREDNILALYANDFRGLEEFAEPFKRIEVAFKGFAKQTELVEIKDFAPIDKFLKDPLDPRLEGFRSDADLAKMLNYMVARLNRLAKPEFLHLYKIMRDCRVQKVGGQVTDAFLNLFLAANEYAEGTSDIGVMILASVTNLAGQILRSGAFNDQIRRQLEANLKHRDQRVRGNTVMALDELAPESYSFREMFNLPFNRAAADALIAEGRREYTAEVHGFLKDFLRSEDPFFVASGLYVLAYLYDYHRSQDPVYFAANEYLQEIPELIDLARESSDLMVRRRYMLSKAQIAGQKAA